MSEENEADSPVVESSVWRLGPGGSIISSVFERHAGWMAEQEPATIFFYANLEVAN